MTVTNYLAITLSCLVVGCLFKAYKFAKTDSSDWDIFSSVVILVCNGLWLALGFYLIGRP